MDTPDICPWTLSDTLSDTSGHTSGHTGHILDSLDVLTMSKSVQRYLRTHRTISTSVGLRSETAQHKDSVSATHKTVEGERYGKLLGRSFSIAEVKQCVAFIHCEAAAQIGPGSRPWSDGGDLPASISLHHLSSRQ